MPGTSIITCDTQSDLFETFFLQLLSVYPFVEPSPMWPNT